MSYLKYRLTDFHEFLHIYCLNISNSKYTSNDLTLWCHNYDVISCATISCNLTRFIAEEQRAYIKIEFYRGSTGTNFSNIIKKCATEQFLMQQCSDGLHNFKKEELVCRSNPVQVNYIQAKTRTFKEVDDFWLQIRFLLAKQSIKSIIVHFWWLSATAATCTYTINFARQRRASHGR